YAYLRRSGYDTHDAQDMTQSFFQHLLENETLRRVSREKGRFRSFLLGVLKRCLAHEQMQRHTLKRGGGTQFISTDELDAEELHHLRMRYEAAPDEILDARLGRRDPGTRTPECSPRLRCRRQGRSGR